MLSTVVSSYRMLLLLLCVATAAESSEQCMSSMMQVRMDVKGSAVPSVVSWDGSTLAQVQKLLRTPETAPSWATAAQKKLLWQADKVKSLPAGIRKSVPAGPWSPTQKKLMPPSGDKRDYMTTSGYAWPCTTKCLDTGYDAQKCKLWDSGKRTFGRCDPATREPWEMHDGFLNYGGLQDLSIMCVAMDTLETLTLAWWFAPLSPERDTYAKAAMQIFRAYFLNESTRINPRFLYGASVPGKNNGSAGALIAPTFRMNSRFVDCASLLQLVGDNIWTPADGAAWTKWVTAWSKWLRESKFGEIEMGAVGNHGTFGIVHKLALDKVLGDKKHAVGLIKKIRTDLAASLAEQIEPSGEMPIETKRVTGAIYSMMNAGGIFLLGTVVQNICKDFSCEQLFDWNWQAPESTGSKWEKYSGKISYCRYRGRGSTVSVEKCKSSCIKAPVCNGVVVRSVAGKLRGCYFKGCKGTNYKFRPGSPKVWTSFHLITPPPKGSGSIRKMVDYLLPYATGKKTWTHDHQGIPKDNTVARWKALAPILRLAAVVFNDQNYADEVKSLDASFDSHRYNLLYPQPQSKSV